MKIELIPEPELEFATGRHVDTRFGLSDFGPISRNDPVGPHEIRVGLVGTAATVAGVKRWVESCRDGVPAKVSRKPNFFPPFPGFGRSSAFDAEFIFSSKLEHLISGRDIDRILSGGGNEGTENLAQLFFQGAEYLSEKGAIDVLVCAPPPELFEFVDRPIVSAAAPGARTDFHDLLKAKGLRLGQPMQLIRPPTYGFDGGGGAKKSLQDPATRAWNFHTALYYKAGGSLWRLSRAPADLSTCYVGISFFKNLEGDIHTSVAQIFNERGEGMILRGGQPKKSAIDRQVHLSYEDMNRLLETLLDLFYKEHSHLPARVVVHKTSGFDDMEIKACNDAVSRLRISSCDLLVLSTSDVRLFRDGQYPPLRGTFVQLDGRTSLLYTRGSVNFFQMYPGMYVPRALEIKSVQTEQPAEIVAREILALTKMNWNNTQFDSQLPITIGGARQISRILKYLDPNNRDHAAYSFFM